MNITANIKRISSELDYQETSQLKYQVSELVYIGLLDKVHDQVWNQSFSQVRDKLNEHR